MNTERLLALASLLDTVDAIHAANNEPGYNQRETIHDCGTPACALGHWAAANPSRFDFNRGTRLISLKGISNAFAVDEIGSVEFDITHEEASELFDSYGCGDAETGSQAAAYIRGFVERNR